MRFMARVIHQLITFKLRKIGSIQNSWMMLSHSVHRRFFGSTGRWLHQQGCRCVQKYQWHIVSCTGSQWNLLMKAVSLQIQQWWQEAVVWGAVWAGLMSQLSGTDSWGGTSIFSTVCPEWDFGLFPSSQQWCKLRVTNFIICFHPASLVALVVAIWLLMFQFENAQAASWFSSLFTDYLYSSWPKWLQLNFFKSWSCWLWYVWQWLTQ